MSKPHFLAINAWLAFQFCSAAVLAASTNISANSNAAPAVSQKQTDSRYKWNVDTLVGDYEKHGRRNPKWDESAKAALLLFAQVRGFSVTPKAEAALSNLPPAVRLALTNGCDDPLLLYLSARFVMPTEQHSWKEYADQYRQVAESLCHGEYTPIRKFYAALRAAEALNPGGKTTPQEVHHWRREASHFLTDAVKDPAMPPAEVYEACDLLLATVKRNGVQLEQFYQALEPILFKNWPSESSLYLLKGCFFVDYAWAARGGSYSSEVPETAWKPFKDRLAEADKALAKAWELNPKDERIACKMISVELGQGQGRSRMELWFKRAMDLNTNYYDACNAKLLYIEPKWYGSPEEMIDFGHQCTNSKKWGGQVPLIIVNAHLDLAKALPAADQQSYWKRPDVWADLSDAFEKFFALNPQATAWRHNYAWYAWKAEQWKVLNRQIPLLGEINYEYFGGKDEYDKMVRVAKEHAAK